MPRVRGELSVRSKPNGLDGMHPMATSSMEDESGGCDARTCHVQRAGSRECWTRRCTGLDCAGKLADIILMEG